MCGTCGCGEPGGPASPIRAHAHEPSPAPGHEARRVEVETSLLAANEANARALRERLAGLGIEAVGLLGAPGCGKTSLLERTLEILAATDPDAPARVAVVEGDCATDHDARRIATRGARVAQIETGALCHLDAHLVGHALEKLDLDGVERVFVENVGNLVCPAPFSCGESRRALLVSTPEGDDKPEKYPAMVAAADCLVVTKTDLLPHLDFDVERCVERARRVRPGLPALAVSARSGAGMDEWLAWLAAGGRR